MGSFWGDELSAWMRLGEQMLGDSVDSFAELSGSFADLTRRAMRPWAEVLDIASRRLVGRQLEYEADGVTGRATIESFAVAGDPARMATTVDATLVQPQWGDLVAMSVDVRATGVHLVPGPLPQARAERIELAARFDAETVAGWFAGSGGDRALRLVSLDDELVVTWRRPRLKLTIEGSPAAAADRLHLVARRCVVLGRTIRLPAMPEVTLAVPLSLPAGLTLVDAAVDAGSLVVTAAAHNVSEPVRPDRLRQALDGRGIVRVRRPTG